MGDESSADPSVKHTVRSRPPLTLRLPIALRKALEAQAAAAGQSVNTHLTHLLADALTPPAAEAFQVRVTLDHDLCQWVDTWRDDDQDVGVVIPQVLAYLHALEDGRVSNAILIPLADDLQAWLDAQGQQPRRDTILHLLRRQLTTRPAS